MRIWSSVIILALDARGREFDSRNVMARKASWPLRELSSLCPVVGYGPDACLNGSTDDVDKLN